VSTTLFISDLHLDLSRPQVIEAFEVFLQQQPCERLYILGDLFEAWIGDDDDSPLADRIRAALAAFTSTGAELCLMQGNRDFLMGETFATAVGGQLLEDPTTIDLYGTPVLLMHGDTLCTADVEYQQFRAMSRSTAWREQALSQSLEARRAMAAQLRQASKEAMSNKAEDIMDVSTEEVPRVMAEAGVTVLIHGHTHRPHCHQQNYGTRWVLGDWDQQGWLIRATPDDIKLESFFIN